MEIKGSSIFAMKKQRTNRGGDGGGEPALGIPGFVLGLQQEGEREEGLI